MKNLILSYFLGAAGLFTPIAGLHRFYLEKPVSGIFYLMTWGFFGIGTIIDLIRMPSLVDDYNLRLLYRSQLLGSRTKLSSPERAILKAANDHSGVVTIPMVTLSSGLSMNDARTELNRLYHEGFCVKDVDEDGNEIFQFKGLKPKKPMM